MQWPWKRTSPGRQAQVASSTSTNGQETLSEQSTSHVGSQQGFLRTNCSQAAQDSAGREELAGSMPVSPVRSTRPVIQPASIEFTSMIRSPSLKPTSSLSWAS
uniref:Uncharacterized protein n=1 Tax=Anopheles farauti TaxID=69004 RepID=A0A182QCZ0_9DIPT